MFHINFYHERNRSNAFNVSKISMSILLIPILSMHPATHLLFGEAGVCEDLVEPVDRTVDQLLHVVG